MIYALSDELAEITPCAEEIQCRDQLGNAVGLEFFVIDHNHDIVGANSSRSDFAHRTASVSSFAGLRIHFRPPKPQYL